MGQRWDPWSGGTLVLKPCIPITCLAEREWVAQEVSLEEVALTYHVRESWDQELQHIPARRGQPF